jgi:hypothetical protein
MEQIPNSTPLTVAIAHRDHPVNKQGINDIFIQLYTEALNSGFLAALPERGWKTLCVLTLHMDPTQTQLSTLPQLTVVLIQ